MQRARPQTKFEISPSSDFDRFLLVVCLCLALSSSRLLAFVILVMVSLLLKTLLTGAAAGGAYHFYTNPGLHQPFVHDLSARYSAIALSQQDLAVW